MVFDRSMPDYESGSEDLKSQKLAKSFKKNFIEEFKVRSTTFCLLSFFEALYLLKLGQIFKT